MLTGVLQGQLLLPKCMISNLFFSKRKVLQQAGALVRCLQERQLLLQMRQRLNHCNGWALDPIERETWGECCRCLLMCLSFSTWQRQLLTGQKLMKVPTRGQRCKTFISSASARRSICSRSAGTDSAQTILVGGIGGSLNPSFAPSVFVAWCSACQRCSCWVILAWLAPGNDSK